MAREDFLLGLTREPDHGYDDEWHRAHVGLRLLTRRALLAQSDSWGCMPTLSRYREVPGGERRRVGQAFGRRAAAQLAEPGARPSVLFVETPFLPGFVDGFLESSCTTPFVLLAVSGGDMPLTLEVQDRIAGLPCLVACFAHNLHAPRAPALFQPMPLGVLQEEPLQSLRHAVLPWPERDRRLLVTPMTRWGRVRKEYLQVLSGDEYQHLVRVVEERLDFESFLRLLSEHQSVLSPPGRGYDCYRTWQALALGTVPLVCFSTSFDQRLYEGSGPEYIPPPDKLTPDILQDLLTGLCDPIRHAGHIEVDFWKSRWGSCLPEVPL